MKANARFPVAIHILTYPAMKGPRITSEELAVSINTNPVVVRRLNARLKRAGLLTVSNGSTAARRSAGRRRRSACWMSAPRRMC